MRRNIRDRDITFRHEDGCLVRTVSGADGRTYTHRCCLEVFEKVAWLLDIGYDACMGPDLLREIQRFEAATAIGASAVRGQPPSTKKTMTDHLAQIELGGIPRTSSEHFHTWLTQITDELAASLPARPGASAWGIARKGLNLFLRDCLYNHYLRSEFHLDQVETWLEVPLDSKVAKGLRRAARLKRQPLPRWRGICNLKVHDSNAFQVFALELATEQRLPARVFLDHGFWLPKKRQAIAVR